LGKNVMIALWKGEKSLATSDKQQSKVPWRLKNTIALRINRKNM